MHLICVKVSQILNVLTLKDPMNALVYLAITEPQTEHVNVMIIIIIIALKALWDYVTSITGKFLVA